MPQVLGHDGLSVLVDADGEAMIPRFKEGTHVTPVYNDYDVIAEVVHLIINHTDTAYMLGCERLWRVASGPFMVVDGPATCLGCAGARPR